MRPHRIHESSSRCDRLDEAEELDTSDEPLFRREPFMERRDLLSVSRSLRESQERRQSNLTGEVRCKRKYFILNAI